MPGTTLTTTTTTVAVTCPTLADGTPVTLSVQAPSALGGYTTLPLTGTYSSSTGAVFSNVALQNGAQTLMFAANPAGGSRQVATQMVTVNAGGCGVWPAQQANQIYNAFGAPVDGGVTPIAGLDAGSGVE